MENSLTNTKTSQFSETNNQYQHQFIKKVPDTVFKLSRPTSAKGRSRIQLNQISQDNTDSGDRKINKIQVQKQISHQQFIKPLSNNIIIYNDSTYIPSIDQSQDNYTKNNQDRDLVMRIEHNEQISTKDSREQPVKRTFSMNTIPTPRVEFQESNLKQQNELKIQNNKRAVLSSNKTRKRSGLNVSQTQTNDQTSVSRCVSELKQQESIYSDVVRRIRMSNYFRKSYPTLTEHIVLRQRSRQPIMRTMSNLEKNQQVIAKARRAVLRKELSRQAKSSAVTLLEDKIKNAPNLTLGNPRKETRLLFQTKNKNLLQNSCSSNEKFQWKEFLKALKNNTEFIFQLQAESIKPKKQQSLSERPQMTIDYSQGSIKNLHTIQDVPQKQILPTRPRTGIKRQSRCKTENQVISEINLNRSLSGFGMKEGVQNQQDDQSSFQQIEMKVKSLQKIVSKSLLEDLSSINQSELKYKNRLQKDSESQKGDKLDQINLQITNCGLKTFLSRNGQKHYLQYQIFSFASESDQSQKPSEDNKTTENLSSTLIKKLGLKKQVKYFHDTTLKKLTGINTITITKTQNTTLEPKDWNQTQLYKRLIIKNKPCFQFNSDSDSRYLTEDQICYCINLLRYCSHEFSEPAKLQEIFDLVIATTQCIYLELGLQRMFSKLSVRLEGEVNLQTCLELLIRCKLMLSVRQMVVSIFFGMMNIEKMIEKFAKMQLFKNTAKQIVESEMTEIEEYIQKCEDLIMKLIEEHKKIIGSEFVFDGVNLGVRVNLKIKMVSLMLQKCNECHPS